MVRIRKRDQKDLSVTKHFFIKECFATEYSEDEYFRRFEFWWTSNPAFRTAKMLGDGLQKIVMIPQIILKVFLGNIPADYNINGKTYTSCFTINMGSD